MWSNIDSRYIFLINSVMHATKTCLQQEMQFTCKIRSAISIIGPPINNFIMSKVHINLDLL
jgi:hypothetical protein